MDTALAQRIDRLESRFEIAELCSSYCIACDDRDLARLRSLFTPDAKVHSVNGMMDATGLEVVMAMFEAMLSIRGPAFHWTHDRFVTFDDTDPDRASGLLLAHAETTPGGVASIAAIRYEDAYRRFRGRWRFAERKLSFLYYMPIADFIGHFPTSQRMGVGGEWSDADFPETLATWRTDCLQSE